MGLNALNVELNNAIDSEDWELAQKIQQKIQKTTDSRGLHEIIKKNLRSHLN